MVETSMIQVTVDGEARAYPYGTTYRAIAADVQDRYPNDILLVNRDGKLCELHKRLDRDCTLRMITARDVPGIQTYERSAVFLMLKAFYDVAGRENVERLSVGYSLSRSLFIRAQGDFVHYFYGYMVPDTGYVRCFGLELFESGFVLRLPTLKDPDHLGQFQPSLKVFRELYDSTLLS